MTIGTALTPSLPSALPAVPAPDLAAAKAYARADKSKATRRAYAGDYAAFCAWCAHRSVAALPAIRRKRSRPFSHSRLDVASSPRPLAAAWQQSCTPTNLSVTSSLDQRGTCQGDHARHPPQRRHSPHSQDACDR